jgi:hypothetical protein
LNPGVSKAQFTNAYLGAMIEDDPKASALVVVEQIATGCRSGLKLCIS